LGSKEVLKMKNFDRWLKKLEVVRQLLIKKHQHCCPHENVLEDIALQKRVCKDCGFTEFPTIMFYENMGSTTLFYNKLNGPTKHVSYNEINRYSISVGDYDDKSEKLVYLAGPMEDAEDNGLEWRVNFRESLKQFNLNCIVPEEHEEGLIPEGTNIRKLKKDNIQEYIKYIRKFMELDLNFVEDADFIIVKYEGEETSGTIGEAQYAYQLRKPVILISSLPEEKISGWFLSCCSVKLNSLEELIEYLKEEQKNGWKGLIDRGLRI
jgi:nucleoside 2-deoxyribosyltransferase